jgi:outer membrane protein assembly factor BamB
VVNNVVFVGNSGAELGVRGQLTALDAHTGKILWKAYSSGSDQDVRLGPDFKPSTRKTAAKISASRPGLPANGSWAAAPSGAGSPTIPSSI